MTEGNGASAAIDQAPGKAGRDAGASRAGAHNPWRTPPSDYATLKERVRRAGLLDRQPRYYALKIGVTLGLLGLSLAGLALIHSVWLQMLNAVFLAFVDTQVGFLAHNIGHRQVFRGRRRNLIGGLTVGNLLLGMSEEWWIDKHNRHHRHPNHAGLDRTSTCP